MTDRTASRRVKAFNARQEAKGLRLVRVWVPKIKGDELKRFAKKLCDDGK